MKIGLISAEKHCKTHLQALRKDGYDVTCLGARPTSIPPSYDVLVVRVASISHGGDATARAWARETGKPAIYEDGLSGIRRGLSTLTESVEADVVEPAPMTDMGQVRQTLLDCAEAFREARPSDTPVDLTKALLGVAYAEFPDLCVGIKAMLPSIVAQAFAKVSHTFVEETPPTIETDPMPHQTDLPLYAGSPSIWPSDVGWASVYTEANVRKSYDEAVQIIRSANHMSVSTFSEGLVNGAFSPRVQTRWEDLLRGKPLTFAFTAIMLVPDLGKSELMNAYRLITGKGMDTRLDAVVHWALGWAEEVAESLSPAVSPDAVESNTEAILTLMDDLSAFKEEIRAERDRWYQDMLNHIAVRTSETAGITEGRIGEQIKALEERVTQVRLDQIPDSDIGSRIKALEVGASETLRQAQTGARMAVEEMREELRSDISNAFDALAAEQQSDDVSSNPLAALEQVKAALRAAGFKGTLTLTIE